MSQVCNDTEKLGDLITSVGNIIENLKEEQTSLTTAFNAVKEKWTDGKAVQFEQIVNDITLKIDVTSKDLENSKNSLEALKKFLEEYNNVSFGTP